MSILNYQKWSRLNEKLNQEIYDEILDIYNEVGEDGLSKEELEYIKSGGKSKIPEFWKDEYRSDCSDGKCGPRKSTWKDREIEKESTVRGFTQKLSKKEEERRASLSPEERQKEDDYNFYYSEPLSLVYLSSNSGEVSFHLDAITRNEIEGMIDSILSDNSLICWVLSRTSNESKDIEYRWWLKDGKLNVEGDLKIAHKFDKDNLDMPMLDIPDTLKNK